MNKLEFLAHNGLSENELETLIEKGLVQCDDDSYTLLAHIVRNEGQIDFDHTWKTVREWVFLVQAYKDCSQAMANSLVRNNTNFPHAIDIHGDEVWDYTPLLNSYIAEANGLMHIRAYTEYANISKHYLLKLEEAGDIEIIRTSARKWFVNVQACDKVLKEYARPRDTLTLAQAAREIDCTTRALQQFMPVKSPFKHKAYPKAEVLILKKEIDDIKKKCVPAQDVAKIIGKSRQQVSNLIDNGKLTRVQHPLTSIVWVTKSSLERLTNA